MLILSRKNNEEIKIGTDITFKIISISDNQVKIGVTAPRDVEILRGEIYEKVKSHTIEATRSSGESIANLGGLTVKKMRKSDG